MLTTGIAQPASRQGPSALTDADGVGVAGAPGDWTPQPPASRGSRASSIATPARRHRRDPAFR
ncbi:MAG: hypothetical protein LKI24_03410 [Acidipropionibacterium sp.]|nr:hypothetical protein [Acidipropionibacterium sp.]